MLPSPADAVAMEQHDDPASPDTAPRALVPGHEGPVHALVVGASRGIGAALAHRLALDPRVEALYLAARHPGSSASITGLCAAHAGRVLALPCDVTDPETLAALPTAIARRAPRLHLVLNAAGVLHDAGLAPEKSIRQVQPASLQRAFAVNATGPLLLAQSLLPLLAHREPAVFASLSARVGSIADNRLGGWYAYRASKAAHNQLLRTFAIELSRLNRRSIVLALHPGTVDTDLSRPFAANVETARLFSPDLAARRLLEVVAGRTPEETGGFFAWDGSSIPW